LDPCSNGCEALLIPVTAMEMTSSLRCLCVRLVPKDILNIQGALYFCTFFIGIVNSLIVQPIAAAERTVFYRERASHMYSVIPYALSLVRAPPLPFTSARQWCTLRRDHGR
jgi:hypothetical protein